MKNHPLIKQKGGKGAYGILKLQGRIKKVPIANKKYHATRGTMK